MSKVNRYVLAALGVLVIAAIVALVWKVRGTSEANSGDGARPVAEAEPEKPTRATPRPRLDDSARATRARAPREPRDEGDAPKEYIRDDGAQVRDHRKGDHPELHSTRPAAGTGKAWVVGSEVIHDVRGAMRPIVKDCAAQLAAEAYGDEAVLQGVVHVKIDEGALVVTDVEVQLRDVLSGGEALADCVREAGTQVALSTPDHEPVEHHTLTMPFRLRR